MNDWMTVDEAWYYTPGEMLPIIGKIVHTARKTNMRAWFIPDNQPVNNGIDVSDEEGVADEGGVWYMREVPRNMVVSAFKDYYACKLRLAENDVRYYKSRLKNLENETENEEGAE